MYFLEQIKKSVLLISMLLISASAYANVADQAEMVCLKSSQISINSVNLLDKSDVVFKKIGQPEQTKRYEYHSGGNAGSYFLKDLIYQGLTFTVADEQKREKQIERINLSNQKYKLGTQFYIGQKKSEIMALLGMKSEKEVMSLAERDILFSGKTIKLSTASKKNWALNQCGDDDGTTNIEFYFDADHKLSQVKIYFDDSFI
ncbi:hypothetical protein [Janthinobacterium sp. B9-8]|uniref:hypothetical protein n=1 Tax=Janthinobacterium sp. B9-8 TaxID=1236179 RepID=UPI00061D14D4|nr:hypothetical protein [Janthinobacterium sp. B9-8]AMC35544.1 hypothetical protein VN23_13430 [Janthinobacterium sp. B9-8]